MSHRSRPRGAKSPLGVAGAGRKRYLLRLDSGQVVRVEWREEQEPKTPMERIVRAAQKRARQG